MRQNYTMFHLNHASNYYKLISTKTESYDNFIYGLCTINEYEK
jgi:hypothetical protein